MRFLFLALSLILTSATATAQTLAREQVLYKGNGPEPETLDPHKAEGVNTANILRDLFEGLTIEAPDGKVIPGAASRWEISEDGRVYTFHLRDPLHWSNGDALTADDFVYSFRRSVDPATGSNYSAILAPIENAEAIVSGKLPPTSLGVTAVDAHTLVIRLRAPTPYFLGLLNHSTTYPVHRGSLEKFGALAFRPEHLVGNGAFKIVEWRVQSHVLVVRNHQYWDDAHTTLERVFYLNTEDVGSEFKRYRAGELDWTEGVPLTQMRWVQKNSNQAALIVATSALWIAWFGTFGAKGEKLRPLTVAGLLLGFAGVAVLVGGGISARIAPVLAYFALLLAPITWAIGSVYARRHPVANTPLVTAALQMLTAGIIMTIIGVVTGESSQMRWEPRSFIALAYLIVFGSCIAYAAYVWLVHEVTPALLGTYAYVNPAVAVFLGWLMLDETLTQTQVIGTLVILLSVIMVTLASTSFRRR